MSGLFKAMLPRRLVQVAVERAVDRYPDGLTYALEESLADAAAGDRVMVPLGKGNTPTAGTIIEILDAAQAARIEPEHIKAVLRRERTNARLPGDLIRLARWISQYYCTPIGTTLATMLPAAVKKDIGRVQRELIDLPATPPVGIRLKATQERILDVVRGLDASRRPLDARILAREAGLKSVAPIRRLVDKGALVKRTASAIEAAWRAKVGDGRLPEALTKNQRGVVDLIGSSIVGGGGGFGVHLLFGVTGSGKTEVYIRLIERALEAGRTALVLVPEISLTPQTGGRLIARFPNERVAVLHSGLTAAQRHQQWQLAASGEAKVVIGARSAVFAPVPDRHLGLIIVDEEHDGSYKQDQAPRYHGRDVAIRRAQLSGCPIVLGSATPSLESWHNAAVRNSYELHRLPERAPGLCVPQVVVVDLAEERRRRAREDRGVSLIGPTLEMALHEALNAGGQALLLLNRRGFANYIACPDATCGWVMTCTQCDVTMVYHLHAGPRGRPDASAARTPEAAARRGYVVCHHCRSEQRLPQACPVCSKRITTFGLGTQRVEEELLRRFPELARGRGGGDAAEGGALVRMDSDTMTGGSKYEQTLERFGAGEIRVLVGTQMIAKGLDFPGVRVVGVIQADTALHLPDFRSTERTFQLVSQVAGRCGRGRNGGIAIVQTFNPQAAAIRLAAAHAYEQFAALELEERARCGLPPMARMTRIVVRDDDHLKAIRRATDLAAGLRDIVADLASAAVDGVQVLGPAPCAIARVAGKHRQQVEVMAHDAPAMQRVLTAARNRALIRSDADMAVDVDPIVMV